MSSPMRMPVVVRRGVIERFWADREEQRTLFGKKVENESGEKK